LLGLGIWLGVAKPWEKPVVAVTEAGPEKRSGEKPTESAPAPTPVSERAPRERELTPQERLDAQLERLRSEGRAVAVEEEDEEMPAVFGPGDGKKMRKWLGEEAVVEGVLFRVRDSKSGSTRYLEFSDKAGQDVLCVRCWPSEELALETLKELEGKKLRFSGKIELEKNTKRIVLQIKERSQIEEVG
jgi:DNA polymerase III alpha subunit (gram-positive type)